MIETLRMDRWTMGSPMFMPACRRDHGRLGRIWYMRCWIWQRSPWRLLWYSVNAALLARRTMPSIFEGWKRISRTYGQKETPTGMDLRQYPLRPTFCCGSLSCIVECTELGQGWDACSRGLPRKIEHAGIAVKPNWKVNDWFHLHPDMWQRRWSCTILCAPEDLPLNLWCSTRTWTVTWRGFHPCRRAAALRWWPERVRSPIL